MILNERLSDRAIVAGLDEVGRGCIAGPMVVAVAAYRVGPCPIEGVKDSKLLSASQRERLIQPLLRHSLFFRYGWVEPETIDRAGISEAWQMACASALDGAPEVERLYVDGTVKVKSFDGEQRTVIKGDLRIWQIAAASIIAKVIRDAEMIYQAGFYPEYGWKSNKGYGTAEHYRLLLENGVTREHRRTFLRKWARKKGLRL